MRTVPLEDSHLDRLTDFRAPLEQVVAELHPYRWVHLTDAFLDDAVHLSASGYASLVPATRQAIDS